MDRPIPVWRKRTPWWPVRSVGCVRGSTEAEPLRTATGTVYCETLRNKHATGRVNTTSTTTWTLCGGVGTNKKNQGNPMMKNDDYPLMVMMGKNLGTTLECMVDCDMVLGVLRWRCCRGWVRMLYWLVAVVKVCLTSYTVVKGKCVCMKGEQYFHSERVGILRS